jgi:colanic acid biosynthesis glycosyl transferase WcaI
MADIHLLPQKRGVSHFAMPSKLGGMLASGRACVVQADPGCELREVLHRAAVLVEPEDPLSFAQAVRALALDPVSRTRLSNAARTRAASLLARDAILSRFAQQLVDLAQGKTGPVDPITARAEAA